MRTSLVPLASIGPPEVGRWRELAAAAIEPNPFFEPELVLPAAKALAADPSLLVSVDEDGAWAAAMPVLGGRGWRHLPLRGLSSWTHIYSFFGAPLLRRGAEQAALADWLRPSGGALRPFLGLDLLDADGPFMAALEAAAGRAGASIVVYEEHERAALHRTPEGLGMRLGSKRRRENARLGRRLGEALGGAEITVVDRAGDPAAAEDFLALESSGWKGTEGTALRSDPAHAEFFRSLCEGFGRLGRLQLLSLEGGGRAAAIKCDIVAGGTVFCFKTAFDESLAEFSPGVQLERGIVDYMGDDDEVLLIDTCAEAGNGMANRVWPDRRRMVSLAVTRGGAAGVLPGLTVRGLARTRKLIRRTQ